MKRIYYSCSSRLYGVKLFEAPASWQRYPNACLRVTAVAVQANDFLDKDRLYSALIRIVRRQMTFNEASASHHISLNIIREVYKKIFNAMSDVMMKLMDQKKKDIELGGMEMDETGFVFDNVSEEELTTITNAKGEEYAVKDNSDVPLKNGRFDELSSSKAETNIARRPVNPPRPPEETVIIKEELLEYRSNGVDLMHSPLVEVKEEANKLGVFPHELVDPKQEEELDEFPNEIASQRQELFDGPILMDETEYANHADSTTDYSSLRSEFKYEDDSEYFVNREIKEEPMDDPVLSQHNDPSFLSCMDDLECYEPMAHDVKKEEEDDEQDVDAPDEEENEEITRAIETALVSSKLAGTQAAVMREALKDSMMRAVPVKDIVNVYGFQDQFGICNLINKARVFLKGICRQAGKSLPAIYAAFNANVKTFVPGEPLDPRDTKRIEKIREVITAIVKRCMYQRTGKEALRAALYSVCVGELTLNAASNKFNLPQSTLHPYMFKARQRLGSVLPPQATAPVLWNDQMKKYKPTSQVNPDCSSSIGLNPSSKLSYAMEELDRTIIDLVITSHYDASGKQAIYEGVLAVITEGISVPEASKRTGIPASTIQTYAGRTRNALNIPTKTEDVEFIPRRKEPPTIALIAKADTATREEVERLATAQLSVMVDTSRREVFFRAVVASVLGEKTIREACEEDSLAPSSIHPYVTKIRHILGKRCPAPKLVVNAKTSTAVKKDKRMNDDQLVTLREDEVIAIDGITVPKSVGLLTRLMTIGQIDYAHAQPFLGSREELKGKLKMIVKAFHYRGQVGNLLEAICHVYVEDQTIPEACQKYKVNYTTLANYARAIKIFIDFSKSPCTQEFTDAANRGKGSNTPEDETDTRRIAEVTRPEIMTKDEIKEEPIDSPRNPLTSTVFLSKADQLKDTLWNGEGIDYITRTMKTLYQHKGWKFDYNGDDNANLLSTLFLPQVSDQKKMDRLKCVIQYVVNDRHAGKRERLYIRPFLIHHLCNGFAIDHLLELFQERIPHTKEQLVEYCNIISEIYKKSGSTMLELVANLTKCYRIFDLKDVERKQQEELMREMRKKFPFLTNERWIPTTRETLSVETLERRKNGCDIYLYYALLAIEKLRELGYLLSDPFINEIVRVTAYNIPHTICGREHGAEWSTQYIKNVIVRNKSRL
ncbi:hypothetical protein PENTCL1PPCAC_28476 [Pristionchus entomophagus]|uniref:HTH psq-type domain-containing protein n=1 Tax=Pristionchus entomophagus TaxID=358040 RepID=A0AAV5UI55_9BILA|nr:hypothetical protein PENTCL1PPCAC_28476 [Pristionchus entomophagus]